MCAYKKRKKEEGTLIYFSKGKDQCKMISRKKYY